MKMRDAVAGMVTTAALVVLAQSGALAQGAKGGKRMSAEESRGRYLAMTAGCNDCHTPGYAPLEGKVEEKLWLTGDMLGWRGPWGTTYPVNIRLYVQKMSEDEWVKRWRSAESRPPMPWFNMRAMTDRDLRALYRYAKHLGPAGNEAPAYVPPDKSPNPPFVQFPAPPKK